MVEYLKVVAVDVCSRCTQVLSYLRRYIQIYIHNIAGLKSMVIELFLGGMIVKHQIVKFDV